VFSTTSGVLPIKETMSGPMGGCVVMGGIVPVGVVGGSEVGRPVEVEAQCISTISKQSLL